MQSFHAAVYAVIVQAGIASFTANGNWFFLVICITFLFQGERILRKIFSMGSSFGTVKDIGEAGLAAWGATRALAGSFGGKKRDNSDDDNKDSDDSDDEDDEEDEDEDDNSIASSGSSSHITRTPTMGAQTNLSSSTSSVNPQLAGLSNAQNFVNNMAHGVRNSRGRNIVSGIAGVAGGTLGATVGASFQLATGADISKVAMASTAGFAMGRSIGKTVIAKPIIGATNAYAGRRYKIDMKNGKYDAELKKVGLDMDAMEHVNTKTADLIRKALAEQTSAAIRRGDRVGDYKFHKTINNGRNTSSSSSSTL